MKKLRVTVEGKAYEVTVEILDQGPEGAPFNPQGVAGAPAPAPIVSAPIVSASVSAPVSAAPAAAAAPAGPGSVVSQLAGKIVAINVKEGDAVKEGDVLLSVEAMKMNTYINAPRAGTVKKINVAMGDAVNEGQSLIELE
ncbi:MAG: hypothetical protein B9S32_17115 [Verrucomicrobia bacterium Tous-C9LFEB]|nr:MAG: hypothetical protein B9S32_17115 [Verrucomicrobia bacterium Tous-C9LFEB]